MTMIAFLLAGVCLCADAGGFLARKEPAAHKVSEVSEFVELSGASSEEDAVAMSLVQQEASVHSAAQVRDAWRNKMKHEMDATHSAATVFHSAISGVIDEFAARVGDDVSGDTVARHAVEKEKYSSEDTAEAKVSLALLEEVEEIKAEILDLDEQSALLAEDRAELAKGLAEIEKNVSMAAEFTMTANSGKYGAPQPHLEMGSFNGLDNDEAAFNAKHDHPSHVDELHSASHVHESALEPSAVLHAIEDTIPTHAAPAGVVSDVLHGAVHDAHKAMQAEKVTLIRKRDALRIKVAKAEDEARPLAQKVLAATYNGVSLNMKVVGQSGDDKQFIHFDDVSADGRDGL